LYILLFFEFDPILKPLIVLTYRIDSFIFFLCKANIIFISHDLFLRLTSLQRIPNASWISSKPAMPLFAFDPIK